MERTVTRRRRVVVDDRPLAAAIGKRIRAARRRVGLTQQALAGSRYTKAYISALETGVAKPSMAALNYLAERLGMPSSAFVSDTETAWGLLDADLRLASGDYKAALEAYQDLLAAEPTRSERPSILLGLSETLCRVDRASEAIHPAAEAAALFGEQGRLAERQYAIYWQAYGHYASDNPDEARSLLRGILDTRGDDHQADPDLIVRVLIALAAVESIVGETQAALAYLSEADALAGDVDARRRATYLHTVAIGYSQSGDYEAAIRAGMRSLTLFREADAQRETAGIANSLALAYLKTQSADRAHDMARLARETAELLGDDRLLASLADTEAQIALADGNVADAERLADESIRLSESTGNRKALLDALVTKARTLVEGGRAEEAIALFERAAEIARSVGPSARRREVLGAWADALAGMGRHNQAYELMREALNGGR
jgi:tetratricopeptide (TPR) repeat protein